MHAFRPSLPLSGLWLVLALVCSALSAQTQTPSSSSSSTSATSSDNTRVNQQDRSGKTMTPFSQPNDKADIQLLAAVRRAVVNGNSSADARNIKIMAVDGNVTLRGVVKNEDEKASVETIVKGVRGVNSLDDQLTLKQ